MCDCVFVAHRNWLRTDCVDVRWCKSLQHTPALQQTDAMAAFWAPFGGSKVTVVCATAWLSVEVSSVDITTKSHLQSKSILEEGFWDAASEIYTDIAKKSTGNVFGRPLTGK